MFNIKKINIMKKITKIQLLSLTLIVSLPIIAILSLLVKSKADMAMYKITTGNNQSYYSNSFRMLGKGIMFDDVYGKSIILVGNIDIEYRKP